MSPRIKLRSSVSSLLCLSFIVPVLTLAAPKPPAVVIELTERVKTFEAAIAKQEQALKAEIESQLPAIDQVKVAALVF